MFGRRGSQPPKETAPPEPAPAIVAEPAPAPMPDPEFGAEPEVLPESDTGGATEETLQDIIAEELAQEGTEPQEQSPSSDPIQRALDEASSAPDIKPEVQNQEQVAPPQAPEIPEPPAATALFAEQKDNTFDGGDGGEVDDGGAKLSDADNARLADIKITVFNDLLEAVDLAELTKLEPDAVREEISDMTAEIISMRRLVLSVQEQQTVVKDICNDILGLGPLEPLIERDGIADIMVNGPNQVYIEVGGRIELTDIKFRDNAQLMNICQRIVTAVGRRVDSSSPICDARLADGSRVNVIAPPLAIDGACLTIRKFSREKLTFKDLIKFESITPELGTVLEVISAIRCNVLISGGTGSGKTTLLNLMTAHIDPEERIITCEDSAELQLQQPHVVRLETRPPNLEGAGEVTMRDLIKNCLRMRPERIVVGEVRGPEAFDLLQAMNTGHDGSMGTIHANTPRESLSRVENMIAMGGYNLPQKAVREQISGAIQVVIQAQRLRDGSRKITHVTEIIGMEGDLITMQDLCLFEIEGEDENGKILGQHRFTGVRPAFWDKARYFGLEQKLATALNMFGA